MTAYLLLRHGGGMFALRAHHSSLSKLNSLPAILGAGMERGMPKQQLQQKAWMSFAANEGLYVKFIEDTFILYLRWWPSVYLTWLPTSIRKSYKLEKWSIFFQFNPISIAIISLCLRQFGKDFHNNWVNQVCFNVYFNQNLGIYR
jgi:hypothetical protein